MGQHFAVPNSNATEALAKASFGLFLGALPQSSSPQGCFLSPVSIVYALALAINGSGTNSSTQKELLHAISDQNGEPLSEDDVNSVLSRVMALLSDGSKATDASQLMLANSIWTAKGEQFKPAYVKAMKSMFQATAREAVNGAQDINDWVSEVTRGMIKDLVPKDEPFDAILANAIYFKGLWKTPFKRSDTAPRNFTTLGGTAKKVHMMMRMIDRTDGAFTAHKKGVYDALSLPYTGGAFSAVALLPARGVEVTAALKDWAAGPEALQPVGRLHVMLPKFKVKSTMSLVPLLKSLGVQSALSTTADFSRMAQPGLFISDVLHEAVVEVDEEGTVAAAATAVAMMRCLPEEIAFDRPFAFMIYHNPTNLPVFVGVVHDPNVEP